jgi:hypothetical protein
VTVRQALLGIGHEAEEEFAGQQAPDESLGIG